MRCLLRSAAIVALVVGAGFTAAQADLLEYVAKPDAAYKWDKVSERDLGQVTLTNLHMVSQVWQGITWEHRLAVYRPKALAHPDTAALLITGGNGGPTEDQIATAIATQTGCVMAILFNIPNQPLYGGKTEDALIAYTFAQYLQTGDESWPLLFPMTKSAVRAMDAVQAFAMQDQQQGITRFVVTGASKRGWTTWLTAIADPARVAAIMPMVYDNLDLGRQMPHQLEVWGQYSEQIADYTRRGLQQQFATEKGRKLAMMVDPYTYRDRVTMPKLIINGTNDPYWAQDALNIYWNDLKGDKCVLYDPNCGHGLQDVTRALGAAAAFTRCIASREPLPKMNWKHSDDGTNARLQIRAGPGAKEARLWVVQSATQDFRKGTWVSVPMTQSGAEFVGETPKPKTGFAAVFGEVTFEQEGRQFSLSTQIRILGAPR
jgi:PhoPQ-activated pathogenicity-related protein